jgi:hypothetical protein
MACLTAFLLCAILQSAASHAGAPAVVGRTQLSAQPPALSAGPAGPFNRIAFDIDGLMPTDPSLQVTCIYPGNFRYRCDAAVSEPEAGSARRRVTVSIPDLGKGGRITVRFSNAKGAQDAAVALANMSQVIHEIEALPLSQGGHVSVGGDGQPLPVMQVVSERATSVPAIATSTLGAPPACDQVHAEWVNASATDPVFQSQFGPLNGSIVLSKPVPPGSRVRPDNVPEWLVSYPLSALRMQFIAHYEVIYRVGACQNRQITD